MRYKRKRFLYIAGTPLAFQHPQVLAKIPQYYYFAALFVFWLPSRFYTLFNTTTVQLFSIAKVVQSENLPSQGSMICATGHRSARRSSEQVLAPIIQIRDVVLDHFWCGSTDAGFRVEY